MKSIQVIRCSQSFIILTFARDNTSFKKEIEISMSVVALVCLIRLCSIQMPWWFPWLSMPSLQQRYMGIHSEHLSPRRYRNQQYRNRLATSCPWAIHDLSNSFDRNPKQSQPCRTCSMARPDTTSEIKTSKHSFHLRGLSSSIWTVSPNWRRTLWAPASLKLYTTKRETMFFVSKSLSVWMHASETMHDYRYSAEIHFEIQNTTLTNAVFRCLQRVPPSHVDFVCRIILKDQETTQNGSQSAHPVFPDFRVVHAGQTVCRRSCQLVGPTPPRSSSGSVARCRSSKNLSHIELIRPHKEPNPNNELRHTHSAARALTSTLGTAWCDS